MRQQKGKNILIYFFLFLIVCSVNNTVLTGVKLENIKISNEPNLSITFWKAISILSYNLITVRIANASVPNSLISSTAE